MALALTAAGGAALYLNGAVADAEPQALPGAGARAGAGAGAGGLVVAVRETLRQLRPVAGGLGLEGCGVAVGGPGLVAFVKEVRKEGVVRGFRGVVGGLWACGEAREVVGMSEGLGRARIQEKGGVLFVLPCLV